MTEAELKDMSFDDLHDLAKGHLRNRGATGRKGGDPSEPTAEDAAEMTDRMRNQKMMMLVLNSKIDAMLADKTTARSKDETMLVMIAREHAARQMGESKTKRGERRNLRRWIMLKRPFHQRTCEKVMERSQAQIEQSRHLMPWRRQRDAAVTINRPSGRIHHLSDLQDHPAESNYNPHPACPTCGDRKGELHEASNSKLCHTCDTIYPLPTPRHQRPIRNSRNNHRKRRRLRGSDQDQPATKARKLQYHSRTST